jgi:hypothetical protein
LINIGGQKARNEQYFSQLGNANESRPAQVFSSDTFLYDPLSNFLYRHLSPNQEGKFTGFGNPQCKSLIFSLKKDTSIVEVEYNARRSNNSGG